MRSTFFGEPWVPLWGWIASTQDAETPFDHLSGEIWNLAPPRREVSQLSREALCQKPRAAPLPQVAQARPIGPPLAPYSTKHRPERALNAYILPKPSASHCKIRHFCPTPFPLQQAHCDSQREGNSRQATRAGSTAREARGARVGHQIESPLRKDQFKCERNAIITRKPSPSPS